MSVMSSLLSRVTILVTILVTRHAATALSVTSVLCGPHGSSILQPPGQRAVNGYIWSGELVTFTLDIYFM